MTLTPTLKAQIIAEARDFVSVLLAATNENLQENSRKNTIESACLLHSVAVMVAAQKHKIGLALQAGGAGWQINDHPVGNNTFGYKWSLNRSTQQALTCKQCGKKKLLELVGGDIRNTPEAIICPASTQENPTSCMLHLPEIHIWCFMPSTLEVVDLSTKHLAEQAMVTAGITVEKKYPDTLWEKMAPAQRVRNEIVEKTAVVSEDLHCTTTMGGKNVFYTANSGATQLARNFMYTSRSISLCVLEFLGLPVPTQQT